jgi:hypothetical protein
MNRFERCGSGRFWKGVAQITRSRDRTFIASLCFLTRFSISSISLQIVAQAVGSPGFPLSRAAVRSESSCARAHSIAKRYPKRSVNCAVVSAVVSRLATLILCELGRNRRRIHGSSLQQPGSTLHLRGLQKPLFSRPKCDLELQRQQRVNRVSSGISRIARSLATGILKGWRSRRDSNPR